MDKQEKIVSNVINFNKNCNHQWVIQFGEIYPVKCKKCNFVPDGKESFNIALSLLNNWSNHVNKLHLDGSEDVCLYGQARSLMGVTSFLQYIDKKRKGNGKS